MAKSEEPLFAMFPEIKVEITRFVLDHFPVIVECKLIDAYGREHLFHEKAPIVTSELLDIDSAYPRQGTIGCHVLEEKLVDNQEIFRVNTEKPCYVESTTGEVEFNVFREQLVGLNDN